MKKYTYQYDKEHINELIDVCGFLLDLVNLEEIEENLTITVANVKVSLKVAGDHITIISDENEEVRNTVSKDELIEDARHMRGCKDLLFKLYPEYKALHEDPEHSCFSLVRMGAYGAKAVEEHLNTYLKENTSSNEIVADNEVSTSDELTIEQ